MPDHALRDSDVYGVTVNVAFFITPAYENEVADAPVANAVAAMTAAKTGRNKLTVLVIRIMALVALVARRGLYIHAAQ
jgi:hypothetical protein